MAPYTTGLEIGFFLLTVMGTSMSLWGLSTAAKDFKVRLAERERLHQHERRAIPPLWIATLNRMYQVAFRLAIHSAMLIVSGMAMIFPPPPPDYGDVPQVLASLLGWVVVAILLVTKEIMDRRERSALEKLYDKHYPPEVQ